MKTTLENGSSIKTIDLDVENIRSRRAEAQLQYYNKYIDEIIKVIEFEMVSKIISEIYVND